MYQRFRAIAKIESHGLQLELIERAECRAILQGNVVGFDDTPFVIPAQSQCNNGERGTHLVSRAGQDRAGGGLRTAVAIAFPVDFLSGGPGFESHLRHHLRAGAGSCLGKG